MELILIFLMGYFNILGVAFYFYDSKTRNKKKHVQNNYYIFP